jgi:hypothetical protein
VSGISRIPVPGKSSRGVDLFGRAAVAGSREVNRWVEQRPNLRCSKNRGRAPSSNSQSDGNATLTQAGIDAEVHPPDSEFGRRARDGHRGHRLLQSVAAEVARQAKSRALPAACAALRFVRCRDRAKASFAGGSGVSVLPPTSAQLPRQLAVPLAIGMRCVCCAVAMYYADPISMPIVTGKSCIYLGLEGRGSAYSGGW